MAGGIPQLMAQALQQQTPRWAPMEPGRTIHITLKLNAPWGPIQTALEPGAGALERARSEALLRQQASDAAAEWLQETLRNGLGQGYE